MSFYRLHHLGVCVLVVILIPLLVTGNELVGWKLWFCRIMFSYACFSLGWAIGDLTFWLWRRSQPRPAPDPYELVDVTRKV